MHINIKLPPNFIFYLVRKISSYNPKNFRKMPLLQYKWMAISTITLYMGISQALTELSKILLSLGWVQP